MFLLIRLLLSGRGGRVARLGILLVVLALAALLVYRIADGSPGAGLVPAIVVVALLAFRLKASVRRRRAWPAGGGAALSGPFFRAPRQSPAPPTDPPDTAPPSP